MIRNCFCLLLLLCLASGCDAGRSVSSRREENAGGDTIRYATGFKVNNYEEYAEIEVYDPWKKGRLLQRYILVPRDRPTPSKLPQRGTIVRTPARNMIVYSSVHCTMLEALGATDDIIGVCESRYIMTKTVRERIDDGRIKDMGESSSPSVEKIIASGAEIIIASPLENGSYGEVGKTGVPLVECADYMETDPLGRAEWIKFVGLLTGREKQADSLFRKTEAEYLRLKALAAAETQASRPRLLTGMRYGSQWYVSAGDSYMARIYRDAGADYIFGYLPGTGGAPLSFETILDKAISANVWLIHYNRDDDMTYDALEADDPSYNRFDAFRQRRIYGCNTSRRPYYDETPLHPDYLLEELIALFHPQLLPGYSFRYFAPLE